MSLTERPDGAEQDTPTVDPEARAAHERTLAELQEQVAAAGRGAGEPGLVGEMRAGLDAAVGAALTGGPPAAAGASGPTSRGEPVRVMIEVLAGLVPGGTPDPDLTRRWCITSREWGEVQAADRAAPAGATLLSAEALAQLAGKAHGYATLLMLQPDRLNWVRVDWVWM